MTNEKKKERQFYRITKERIEIEDLKKDDLFCIENDEFLSPDTIHLATRDPHEKSDGTSVKAKPVGHVDLNTDSLPVGRRK